VFFFYRPKVELLSDKPHPVQSMADVARFYMMLTPHQEEEATLSRLLLLTGKKLPDTQMHERKGGFVDVVGANQDILDVLHEHEYDTKTAKKRMPAARPCGEGIYELVEHGPNGNVHLIYELEIPREPGDIMASYSKCTTPANCDVQRQERPNLCSIYAKQRRTA
jgi:hypothetical protein